ncbi:MAG TPA: hypothetical protein VM889_13145 [Candidatus Thermoplasmatota archaeon]|nr:hypothetical protein [Candidatus Thermoplasmatota archaeon]
MRASGPLSVVLVVLALLVTGCLGGAPPIAEDPGPSPIGKDGLTWWERAVHKPDGHDHRDVEHHLNRTTPNFEVIGYEPLITDYHGRTPGGYACGSGNERDGRRLSVVHSFVSDVAFVVSDVTDPKAPKKVGEFILENTHVYDLSLTPDQKFVLLATSPWDGGPDEKGGDMLGLGGAASTPAAWPRMAWRDACTGLETPVAGPESVVPFTSGIVLIDLKDPAKPTYADFRPLPVYGGHSVQTAEIKGKTLVLLAVPNPSAAPVGAPVPSTGPVIPASAYWLYELGPGATGGTTLNYLSQYRYQDGNLPYAGGMHDGTFHTHPVTNESLLYLAYGGLGMVIVNIDDPRNPKFVSIWKTWSSAGDAAPKVPYMHEALPIDGLWDGRHYTFLGEECVGRRDKTPTCLIFTLDTTDPKTPKLVSAWTLPVDVVWDAGLQYSLHYIGLVNRTLFASLYHGGLWAIDVSTPEALATMPSIGVFLPTEVSPKPGFQKNPKQVVYQNRFGAYMLDGAPTIMDVEVHRDGSMVIYDVVSGLYTVRFDAAMPMVSPEPWPLPGFKAE